MTDLQDLKPPIPYFGGKQILAKRIVALLPEHEHYVDPYCGSLAVFLAKPPSPHETVNDLDRNLVTFWRVLRDRTKDLERVCALTPHSEAEQEQANVREYPADLDDLEVARRVWVQLTQGRGAVASNTGFRHYTKPVGRTSMVDYLDGYLARMEPAASRLRRATLRCRPALEIIGEYGQHHEVLLFVDPPYLGSTRSSGGYRHEMRDPASHRALAKALHDTKSAVVVCGYPSDLYDQELYPGWNRHTIDTSTGQGGVLASRTEVLWSNRPLNARPSLFDLGNGEDFYIELLEEKP